MEPEAQMLDLVYATGCSELSRSRFQRASEVFRFMTMLAPSDERGWLGLGDAHLEAGHVDVAILVLKIGVRLASPNTRCQLGLEALVALSEDEHHTDKMSA